MAMAISIRRLKHPTDDELEQLAEVLHDCVHGGASVSFMLPFPIEEARAYWQSVVQAVRAGDRILIGAAIDGQLRGTVQVVLAQPPNQPHRGDLAKMLVHRSARRLGLGADLLASAEAAAFAEGKTLLVLDTASDAAARVYARAGWQSCGTIPNYAFLPHGGLVATHLFYKELTAP